MGTGIPDALIIGAAGGPGTMGNLSEVRNLINEMGRGGFIWKVIINGSIDLTLYI